MEPAAISCPSCGWQNEATARMCGGCGRPLPTFAPGDARPLASTVALPYEAEAPTVYAPLPAAPPDLLQPVASGPRGWSGSQPAWPDGASAPGRRRPWWRVPLILLIILGVLAGTGLGVWSLAVRPTVHAQVDSALRGALNRAADQAAVIIQNAPPPPSGEYRIDPADLNAAIQQELPKNTPLTNVSLSFTSGRARVGYTMFGRSSFVYTSFYAAGGRVLARNTVVYGVLKLVETGAELQAALNDAFGRLPVTLNVTGVRVVNGVLYIRVGK